MVIIGKSISLKNRAVWKGMSSKNVLLKLLEFCRKNGVDQTERYWKIKSNLNNAGALVYMSWYTLIRTSKAYFYYCKPRNLKFISLTQNVLSLRKIFCQNSLIKNFFLQDSRARFLTKNNLLDVLKGKTKFKVSYKL